MNHMTIDSPDAPWNDNGLYKYCYNGCELTPGEQEDPIFLDGQPHCDRCASAKMKLLTVSDKTEKLVKAIDDANYHLVWQHEFDKDGRVKHI